MLEAWEQLLRSLPSEHLYKFLLEWSSGPHSRRGSPPSQPHKSSSQYAQNTSIFKK